MLRTGSFVVHPTFADWGKGVITKILIDPDSGKHIAIVFWQKPNAHAHHTLNHLQPFVDSPLAETPLDTLARD